MSDYLVNLGTKPAARKAIGAMGLPIPLPQKLARCSKPWTDRPLQDRNVVVGQHAAGELGDVLARTLAAAGADPHVVVGEEGLAPYLKHGEAHGRKVCNLAADAKPGGKTHALVFDATGLETPADLKPVYEFFHGRLRSLARCGRAIVITRPADCAGDALKAAAYHGLDGFVRSMAREMGRKGSTAHIVNVVPGAEERIEPLLRFLLSERSAYISGQAFRVTDLVVKDGGATNGVSGHRRPLDGKVALVTGAARGIGAETARALAREGARVVIMDRPSEDGPASVLAAELGGTMLACDITADDAADVIAAHLDEHHKGHLDVVIHNAGVTRDKMLVNMDEQRWDMVMEVNLLALIRVNEALRPKIRAGGRIVCLSSVVGIAGNAGQSNYTASKAGLIGYVRAIAPHMAQQGIAVNAVAPGFIETKMTAGIPVATREVSRRLCNLSQGGLPQDIAETITYLSSPGAAGLCGNVVRICGGNFIGA